MFWNKKDSNTVAQKLKIDLIYPNPNQPRRYFDSTALGELSNSIATYGIIQPIVVVKQGPKYMIVAGERRYRAATLAGLKEVPVVIQKLDSTAIQEISLIENLQREELNPIESAKAIKKLMLEFGYTQEEVSQKLNKSRPVISNTLRLLNLTPEVITLVEQNKISAGHARALLAIDEPDEQLSLANACIKNGYSVRQLEKKIKNILHPAKKVSSSTLELKQIVNTMEQTLGTKVRAIGNNTKGRIYIDYFTKDDLARIMETLAQDTDLD